VIEQANLATSAKASLVQHLGLVENELNDATKRRICAEVMKMQLMTPSMCETTRVALLGARFVKPPGSVYVGLIHGWPLQHALQLENPSDEEVSVPEHSRQAARIEYEYDMIKG
jgi:hypothetical protein